MSKQRLIDLVERRSIIGKLPKPTEISFTLNKDFNYHALNEISGMLPSEEERFTLTKDVLELWCSKDEESANKVFGNIWRDKHDIPLIATLTGDRKQLRFWVDKAGTVDIDHCDSCGVFYLLQAYNCPIPEAYIELASKIIAPPFRLLNKGLVFGKGNEPNLPKYWRNGYYPVNNSKIDYKSLKH
ncbi:MAG: hypothetical protein WC781_01580 [Candidatus Pacearchaeota archaeon]